MECTIDHIMINTSRYPKSLRFYSWLLPKLGYGARTTYNSPERRTAGFTGKGGKSIWLTETEKDFRSEPFNKGKTGMRELAFSGDSKKQIDSIAAGMAKAGGAVLEGPYINKRGSYQFFFADPDGMKLEIILRNKEE